MIDQLDDLLEDWFNAQFALRVNCIAGHPKQGVREETFKRIYDRANDTRQALAEALSK
jgi:hypothetical protein